jgi:hypothetical protein
MHFKFLIDGGQDNEVIPCTSEHCPCPTGRDTPHIFVLKSDEVEAESEVEAWRIVEARLKPGWKILGPRPEGA